MLPDAPWTLPGQTSLGEIRKKYLLKSLKRLIDWPLPLPPHMHKAYGDVREFLASLYRSQPQKLLTAISFPSVGGPLWGGSMEAAIPNLLIELARQGLIGSSGFFWGAPIFRLECPTLQQGWVFAHPQVGALFENHRVDLGDRGELQLEKGSIFQPLLGGGWLALQDSNPLAMHEAHPDKQGNTLDLGGLAAEAWVTQLGIARTLIATLLPALATEHASLLALIVPVGWHAERSFSASYKEVIGQIYLSYLKDPISLAEALVHETQHNKLNLLSYTDPLLVDGGQERYRSPVRPDPRPLWGILLAIHAYLPVFELYHTAITQKHPFVHDQTRERLEQIRHGNHDAASLLKAHARPTELGKTLLQGIYDLEAAQWERTL